MSPPPRPPDRVWVDAAICIGSGNCVRLAPATFRMGDDGTAQVTDADGAGPEKLRLAERSCPTGAIFIEHSEG
jgi:ferredoxin